MPTVEFLANEFGPRKSVEVSEPVELVDLCDEILAPIPFSCRSASCATCQIEIIEGIEHFEPPESAERELLDILSAPPNHRLACQAKLKPGPGIVRIRPAAF